MLTFAVYASSSSFLGEAIISSSPRKSSWKLMENKHVSWNKINTTFCMVQSHRKLAENRHCINETEKIEQDMQKIYVIL